MNLKASFLGFIVGVLFAGCSSDRESSPSSKPLESSEWGAQGIIDESIIDRSVPACEDFYHFACGGWISRTPLPPEKNSITRYWHPLEDRIATELKVVLENYSRRNYSPASENEEILGTYFASCLDEASLENKSLPAFQAELARINSISSEEDLARTLASLHLHDVNPFFSFYSDISFEDSSKTVGMVDRAGMGFPERDYYLDSSDRMKELRSQYVVHIAKMLKLIGYSEAEAAQASKKILEFETYLSKHTLKLSQRRDYSLRNHPMNANEFKNRYPSFAWDAYFQELNLSSIKEVNVNEPEFFEALEKYFSLLKTSAVASSRPSTEESVPTLSVEDAKIYVKWHILKRWSKYLTQPFQDEWFDFWQRKFSGNREALPRWRACLEDMPDFMSEALAQAYLVDAKFTQEKKDVATQMVQSIVSVMDGELTTLDWLDQETLREAKAKIQTLRFKIGFPDRWHDMRNLRFESNSYFSNMLQTQKVEGEWGLSKIDRPTEDWEWSMLPQEINAQYESQTNQMYFMAGILQPPSFDISSTDAANYGVTGQTMGHELSHAFDDSGSDFDSKGNYRNWWSKETKENFKARTACYAKQAEDYPIHPTLRMNGQQTLGENVADNAGLKLAWIALQEKGKNRKGYGRTIAGFTEGQQFFLAYAQQWCSVMTPEAFENQIRGNYHQLNEFRVNGVVINMPEFAKAFSCDKSAKLNPQNRCSVW